jgi:hypothetical protein
MIKPIEPANWNEFLADFSGRNRGRRARFELFTDGSVREEDEEAVFERIAVDKDLVTVTRMNRSTAKPSEIGAEVTGVQGIAVQYDTDDSENTLQFTDARGNMTVLHFESMIDGES